MFCEECGNQLSENARFCPKCGHEMAAQAAPVQPLPVGLPKTPAVSPGNVPAKGAAADRSGGGALSIVFSVLIVLIGIWVSVIFLVRHVTSEKVVDSVVRGLDLSEIEVGFLTEDGGDMTLAEYISDYADSIFPIPWSEKDVRELLNQKFIRNFAIEKVNDYVRDLFHGTGEGVIKVNEIKSLLKKNENAIYKITGVHLTEDDLDYMADIMTDEEILENTALSEYRHEDPGMFSIIKTMFSYWMLILLLIVAILLILGIFLVQGKKLKSFLYLGISLVSIGFVDLITSIFIVDSLAEKMNGSLELGRKFWRPLFAPVQRMSVTLGIVLTVAGVISGLVYIVTALCGKRAGKPEKMRAGR